MRNKMRKPSIKYIFFIAIVFTSSYLFSSFFIAPYSDELGIHEYFQSVVQLICPDDTSCYSIPEFENDSRLEYQRFPPNSIFFHETSCRKILTLRRACAIEAAARAHTDRQVIVLITSPIKELWAYQRIIGVLLRLPNVQLNRVYIDTYTNNTPLEGNRKLKRIKNNRAVAEILKFVTLYKFGGTALDLEMIVAKQLQVLGSNWVVKETDQILSTAIFSLEKNTFGTRVVEMMLRWLNSRRYFDEMSGKAALTETLKEICSTRHVNNMTGKLCGGIQVYDTLNFFPISRSNRLQYYRAGKLQDTCGYYLWNADIYRNSVPSDSLFLKVTKKYCPSIFERFIVDFVK